MTVQLQGRTMASLGSFVLLVLGKSQFLILNLLKRIIMQIFGLAIFLSSSRTSVLVKLGLFNAKIRNENRRYIHRITYQLNEQDLLCHSI